jgi:hypothetical protein
MYWARRTPEDICILVDYFGIIILSEMKYIAHNHKCLYMQGNPIEA